MDVKYLYITTALCTCVWIQVLSNLTLKVTFTFDLVTLLINSVLFQVQALSPKSIPKMFVKVGKIWSHSSPGNEALTTIKDFSVNPSVQMSVYAKTEGLFYKVFLRNSLYQERAKHVRARVLTWPGLLPGEHFAILAISRILDYFLWCPSQLWFVVKCSVPKSGGSQITKLTWHTSMDASNIHKIYFTCPSWKEPINKV